MLPDRLSDRGGGAPTAPPRSGETEAHDGREVDPPPPVILLRWPDDADLRADLVADQVRRLLVLDETAPPPLVWDDLEDWVRSTAGPVEVRARLQRLEQRGEPSSPPGPVLDADGILWCGSGSWVSIPPVEARLLRLLLHRRNEVVSRDDLWDAGWPARNVDRRAVDGRIKLLRRRLAPRGLGIRTVRGVGYLLDGAGPT